MGGAICCAPKVVIIALHPALDLTWTSLKAWWSMMVYIPPKYPATGEGSAPKKVGWTPDHLSTLNEVTLSCILHLLLGRSFYAVSQTGTTLFTVLFFLLRRDWMAAYSHHNYILKFVKQSQCRPAFEEQHPLPLLSRGYLLFCLAPVAMQNALCHNRGSKVHASSASVEACQDSAAEGWSELWLQWQVLPVPTTTPATRRWKKLPQIVQAQSHRRGKRQHCSWDQLPHFALPREIALQLVRNASWGMLQEYHSPKSKVPLLTKGIPRSPTTRWPSSMASPSQTSPGWCRVESKQLHSNLWRSLPLGPEKRPNNLHRNLQGCGSC